jgi:5'-3' exonuclease
MKGIFELDAALPTAGNNLLVVDALNLSFRYKHKRQKDFAADFVRSVESFAKSYECGKVIIAADKGKSSYRRAIFPEYKGNREAKYATQTEEEKQEFAEFLNSYEDALKLAEIRFPLLRFQGVEADDIIAVVAKELPAKFDKLWIISTDKDFDQLINEKVNRFCYYTRKEIRLDNFADKYDCAPADYISRKVLEGDSGDNVPGIALVGAKRGAALLRQYGTAFDIHDSIPLPGTAQYIKNINNFKDQILINYELMDLDYCYDAVGEHYTRIKEILDEVSRT